MGRESSGHVDDYHVLKADPVPFGKTAFLDTINTLAWTG
jgi:hypothetical protein